MHFIVKRNVECVVWCGALCHAECNEASRRPSKILRVAQDDNEDAWDDDAGKYRMTMMIDDHNERK